MSENEFWEMDLRQISLLADRHMKHMTFLARLAGAKVDEPLVPPPAEAQVAAFKRLAAAQRARRAR